jgi:hypothetical protein
MLLVANDDGSRDQHDERIREDEHEEDQSAVRLFAASPDEKRCQTSEDA